jgi:hypothetical protein
MMSDHEHEPEVEAHATPAEAEEAPPAAPPEGDEPPDIELHQLHRR